MCSSYLKQSITFVALFFASVTDDVSTVSNLPFIRRTVVAGSSVTLTCSTDTSSGLLWDYQRPEAHDTTSGRGRPRDQNGGEHRYRFHFDARAGNGQLVINDVQLTDAGIYLCYDRQSGPEVVKMAVELIVIGNVTLPSKNEEEDVDLVMLASVAVVSLSLAVCLGFCGLLVKRFVRWRREPDHHKVLQTRDRQSPAKSGPPRDTNVYEAVYTSTSGMALVVPQVYAELKRPVEHSDSFASDQTNSAVDTLSSSDSSSSGGGDIYEEIHDYLEVAP